MIAKFIQTAQLAAALSGTPDSTIVKQTAPLIDQVRTESQVQTTPEGFTLTRQRNLISFPQGKFIYDEFKGPRTAALDINTKSCFTTSWFDMVSLYSMNSTQGGEPYKDRESIGIGVTKIVNINTKIASDEKRSISIMLNPGYVYTPQRPHQEWMFAGINSKAFDILGVIYGDLFDNRSQKVKSMKVAFDTKSTYIALGQLNDKSSLQIAVHQPRYAAFNMATIQDGKWTFLSNNGTGADTKQFTKAALDEVTTGLALPVFFKPYLPSFTTFGQLSARVTLQGQGSDIQGGEVLAGVRLPRQYGNIGAGIVFDQEQVDPKIHYYKDIRFGHFQGSIDLQASKDEVFLYMRAGGIFK